MTPKRLAALRAMARADESPHERDIARAMLEARGEAVDAVALRPTFTFTTTSSSSASASAAVTIRVTVADWR